MDKRKKIFISVSIVAFLAIIFISSIKSTDYKKLKGFENRIDLRDAEKSNFVEANENMYNMLKQIWESYGYSTYIDWEKSSEDNKKADVLKHAKKSNGDISIYYGYDNLTSYVYEECGRVDLTIYKEVKSEEKVNFEDSDIIKDSINLFADLTTKELQKDESIIDLEKYSKAFDTSYFYETEKVVFEQESNGIKIEGSIKTSYDKNKKWNHTVILRFSIESYSYKK